MAGLQSRGRFVLERGVGVGQGDSCSKECAVGEVVVQWWYRSSTVVLQ